MFAPGGDGVLFRLLVIAKSKGVTLWSFRIQRKRDDVKPLLWSGNSPTNLYLCKADVTTLLMDINWFGACVFRLPGVFQRTESPARRWWPSRWRYPQTLRHTLQPAHTGTQGPKLISTPKISFSWIKEKVKKLNVWNDLIVKNNFKDQVIFWFCLSRLVSRCWLICKRLLKPENLNWLLFMFSKNVMRSVLLPSGLNLNTQTRCAGPFSQVHSI